MTGKMIIRIMDVLVTKAIILTVIMMTYRQNSMEKKLTWTRNWSAKHA